MLNRIHKACCEAPVNDYECVGENSKDIFKLFINKLVFSKSVSAAKMKWMLTRHLCTTVTCL